MSTTARARGRRLTHVDDGIAAPRINRAEHRGNGARALLHVAGDGSARFGIGGDEGTSRLGALREFAESDLVALVRERDLVGHLADPSLEPFEYVSHANLPLTRHNETVAPSNCLIA